MKNALISRSIAHRSMMLKEERDEHLTASRKMPFFTALWASGGIGIMAAFALDNTAPLEFMREHGVVAIPFVLGVYAASYTMGRLLARERVRKNIFASVLVSFLVAEVVLLIGSFFGSGGFLFSEIVAGGHIDFEGALGMPFIIALFGAMFSFPLSVGLGLHVRLWSKLEEQRAAKRALLEESADEGVIEGYGSV